MTARFGKITKDLGDRLALVVAMLTRIAVLCILLLVLGTIADGNAASTLRMTCSGIGALALPITSERSERVGPLTNAYGGYLCRQLGSAIALLAV
jgi:hypothetical protein